MWMEIKSTIACNIFQYKIIHLEEQAYSILYTHVTTKEKNYSNQKLSLSCIFLSI